MNTMSKGKDEFHYTEPDRGSITDLFSEQELEEMGLIISRSTRERLEEERRKKEEREREWERTRIEMEKRAEQARQEDERLKLAIQEEERRKVLAVSNGLVLPDEALLYRLIDAENGDSYWNNISDIKIGDTSIHRRTRNLAEAIYDDELATIPQKLFIPTHKDYRDSFSSDFNEHAYLRLLRQDCLDVQFTDGVVYIPNNPKSMAFLKYTREGFEELDIQLLRSLFSIIWFNLQNEVKELFSRPTKKEIMELNDGVNKLVTKGVRIDFEIACDKYSRRRLFHYGKYVYIPDLLKYLGVEHPNSKQINDVIDEIKKFAHVYSIMQLHAGRYTYKMECPVLIWNENCELTNTVYIQSPYINNLVKEMVFDESQVLMRRGKPKLDQNGEKILLEKVGTGVDPRIRSARNKRAVELTIALYVYMTTSGPKKNIKPQTLIDKVTFLREDIENSKLEKFRKNQLLKRAFSSMWDYVEKYTDLGEKYVLPKIIPTVETKNIGMEFPLKEQKKQATNCDK